jgi:hypothetical protein
MNRFNQTCSTIRRNLSSKTRKGRQKKFYKVTVVPVTYIWIQNLDYNKKQEEKFETAEMNFFMN